MTNSPKWQYKTDVYKQKESVKKGLFRDKKSKRFPRDPDFEVESVDGSSKSAHKDARALNKIAGVKAKVSKKLSDERTISQEQRLNSIEEGADPGENTPETRRNLREALGPARVLNPDIPYEHISADDIYSGKAIEDVEGVDLKEKRKEREDRRIKQEIYDMRDRLMDEREAHEDEKKGRVKGDIPDYGE
tara:strand:+ start:410 stop:979 length:570 start_codon:yes stop_codon:yes gene_type:complete